LQRRTTRRYNYYSGLWHDAVPMIFFVAQRYNTNLQQQPQLLIKPKKICITMLKNFFNFKGQGFLNLKKWPAALSKKINY
jgi:hypothetical protein